MPTVTGAQISHGHSVSVPWHFNGNKSKACISRTYSGQEHCGAAKKNTLASYYGWRLPETLEEGLTLRFPGARSP
jgi:hypothetical protein